MDERNIKDGIIEKINPIGAQTTDFIAIKLPTKTPNKILKNIN